jgi:hypothetical protein
MTDRYFEDRRKALEFAFFSQRNKELLEKVKQDLDAEHKRGALKQATGIVDDSILDRIIELGVSVESLAALSIAPLVLVAWADGSMSTKERDAILAGAAQAGIKADTVAAQLLEGWLSKKPDTSLEVAWKSYTRAVCDRLVAGDHIKLREKVMGRCQMVAEAAGGFLGLGSISNREQGMLDDLSTAFDPS